MSPKWHDLFMHRELGTHTVRHQSKVEKSLESPTPLQPNPFRSTGDTGDRCSSFPAYSSMIPPKLAYLPRVEAKLGSLAVDP